jgi:hypothetical protein
MFDPKEYQHNTKQEPEEALTGIKQVIGLDEAFLPLGMGALSYDLELSDIKQEAIAEMPQIQQYAAEAFNYVNQYDEAAVAVSAPILVADGYRRMITASEDESRSFREFYGEVMDRLTSEDN